MDRGAQEFRCHAVRLAFQDDRDGTHRAADEAALALIERRRSFCAADLLLPGIVVMVVNGVGDACLHEVAYYVDVFEAEHYGATWVGVHFGSRGLGPVPDLRDGSVVVLADDGQLVHFGLL
jgi:hypothetical protein